MTATNTLYRKYRPQTFAEVVGQKHIVTTLENALKLGRVGQAYLLTGPRGTGKTTLARIFAKAVNCSNRKEKLGEPCNKCKHCLLMNEGRSLDVIEIDAASHTGVDNIRELRETVKLPPTLGSHKIYIIDEVHMLSQGAWGALLKTLEEPPAHVIFIMATTALHKVPDTIVSRCQRFDLSRLPIKLITEKLAKIAKQEKLKIDEKALAMIAQTAEGGMRDAESLLAQIASLETSLITEDKVIEILGTTKKENIAALLRLIAKNELYESLSFARKLVEDGTDLSIFCGVFLHYLRDLLLVSADTQNGAKELENLTNEQKTTLLEFASLFTPADIVEMLEYLQVAQVASKTSVIPELPLEIALVKIISEKTKGADSSLPPNSMSESSTTISKNQELRIKNQEVQIQETQKSAITNTNQSPKQITHPSSLPPEAGKHPSPAIDIDGVREKWSAILDKAKQLNASLSLALSTARPLKIQGSTITIAVKYAFHKERLDDPANQLTLKDAFDSILECPTKLRVVLEAELPKVSEDNETSETDKDASLNPLINQALELLGGKLVEEV